MKLQGMAEVYTPSQQDLNALAYECERASSSLWSSMPCLTTNSPLCYFTLDPTIDSKFGLFHILIFYDYLGQSSDGTMRYMGWEDAMYYSLRDDDV